MNAVSTPYEATGRSRQKARTRQALVAAAQGILTEGRTPTVEEAAAAADVSRTTAYRYFPSRAALLTAAYPQVEAPTLLPEDAPDDPRDRLDLVLAAMIDITLRWEPALRTALRLSLETSERPLLRGGRAIGWIEDALEPLRRTRPDLDLRRLAIAVRAATGIEALVWLVDVAGLPREEAAEVLRANGRAILAAALTGPPVDKSPARGLGDNSGGSVGRPH